jgi:hypothetical protein
MKTIKKLFEEIIKQGGKKIKFSKAEKEKKKSLKKLGISIRKGKHGKGASAPSSVGSTHKSKKGDKESAPKIVGSSHASKK